jgi:hypothetical protein
LVDRNFNETNQINKTNQKNRSSSMTNQSGATVDMLQQQLKELEQIFQETIVTLNTVAGAERVSKWKARTVARITESLGQKEGQKFAALQPGPSFTNDLVEEFTDLTDYFRIPLADLAKRLAQAAPPPSGGH